MSFEPELSKVIHGTLWYGLYMPFFHPGSTYYTVMHNNYTCEPLGIQNARKVGRQVEVLATRGLKKYSVLVEKQKQKQQIVN